MPQTDGAVNLGLTGYYVNRQSSAVHPALRQLLMLRPSQQIVQNNCIAAWHEGAINVMPTMATGGGKTVIFCDTVQKFDVPACIVAHRQELVGQAALALTRERVEHAIIAPKKIIQQIITLEHETFGYSTYNSRSPIRCAGVDTIIRRDVSDRWYSQVGFVVVDEGHHVLRDNKWGRTLGMMPNARGMFPTAHCVRADGLGLGRSADGLVDSLIVGPHGRELIDQGFLTDYEVYCPPNDIDFKELTVGASGEFSQPQLRAVTHKSNQIVGNVVHSYLKYAAGKLGITFVVDKEHAIEIRAAFLKEGVPAEIITDNTPVEVRGQLMKKFRARQILQLISVDCLGEGVDVPAIEVVSFARKTASWQLYCQQFGRSLRVLVDKVYESHWNYYSDDERKAIIACSTKPKAIIIDHVGNVLWHAKTRGLPDTKQIYTLDRRSTEARGKSDAIPLRTCPKCTKPYKAYLIKCPYENCGHEPEPIRRAAPEEVDGDLCLLDGTVLAALRGEVDRVNGAVQIPTYAPAGMRRGLLRNHHSRFAAQQALQKIMAVWGGWQKTRGLHDREIQKLFFIRYGIDCGTAQTLNTADAEALEVKINDELNRFNVYEVAP